MQENQEKPQEELEKDLEQNTKTDEIKAEENGIEISTDVIAVIAGVAVSEVQGVAGMSGGLL